MISDENQRSQESDALPRPEGAEPDEGNSP